MIKKVIKFLIDITNKSTYDVTVCTDCGCILPYCENDIHTEIIENKNKFYIFTPYKIKSYVKCPFCKKMLDVTK